MSLRTLYLVPAFVLGAAVVGCSDHDHDYDHHHGDRDREHVEYRDRGYEHRGPDKVIVREEPAGYRYDHDRDYDRH